MGRPVAVLDLRGPAEERDDVVDLRGRNPLLRHLAVRSREDQLRPREAIADRLLADSRVRPGEVGRVIAAEPEDGVAVVAVVPLECALARHDVLIELVGVRERVEVPVRVDGEREE